MNSDSNMDVRGVVPDTGQSAGGPSKTTAPADEHEPIDVTLDGSELVRDVEDGHRELAVEPVEESGERLLRLRVDTRGRLVEDEQDGSAASALAMNARCC